MMRLLIVIFVLWASIATASVSVGVGWSSDGWNGHRWNNHHWHNRHWYGHRWPYRHWPGGAYRGWNDPWNNHWGRHNRYDEDRYDTQQPAVTVVAPKSLPVTSKTVRLEQISRDSIATLPANARTMLTEQGRIYHWQQRCYQLNNLDRRYYSLPCPDAVP